MALGSYQLVSPKWSTNLLFVMIWGTNTVFVRKVHKITFGSARDLVLLWGIDLGPWLIVCYNLNLNLLFATNQNHVLPFIPTWILRHLNTWAPGHLGTRVPGYLGPWVPGHLVTWAPGYLCTWVPGTWTPGYLGIRAPGYLGTWAPSYLGTWLPEPLCTWAPGYLMFVCCDLGLWFTVWCDLGPDMLFVWPGTLT